MIPTHVRSPRFLGVAAIAVILAGCAVPPTMDLMEKVIVFDSTAAPSQVNATARVDVASDMGADLRTFWMRGVQGIEPARSNNYMIALSKNLGRAVVASNLFSHIDLDGSTQPAYLLHVRFDYALASNGTADGRDIVVKLRFETVDAATGKQISVNTGEAPIGVECVGVQGVRFKTERFGMISGYDAMIRGTMNVVNAMLPRMEGAVAAAIADYRQLPEREKALADLKVASLPDLLVSSDPSVAMARERNRCLVAAKVGQLPGMLRSWNTAQLTDLIVKLEQTILDLNHESEVAKDRAEQASASEANSTKVDSLRGLAISYRERIELLKAILTPVKDEVANRNR